MLDHYSDYDHQKIRQEAVGIFGKQAVTEKLRQLYNYVK
jgi:hypothetical protein